MFFILSKTISIILMPIFWILSVFVWGLLTKNPQRKKRAFLGSFILLIVLTNPFLINLLLLWWEIPPTPLKDIKEKYDVGIVLTGITKYDKSPEDRVYLTQGADRITHTLMLYKEGKIKKILITGGIIDLMGNARKSEARRLADFLIMSQVPKEDIILEEKARNTRENALFSQKILEKQFPQQKYLLITSAFHQSRALGCFRKVGLQPIPFSAGFHSSDLVHTDIGSFIPSEIALYHWYILVHEMLGYLVYAVMGYL
jgi:uncharacterized SAM-binding protein YcdF (DUF218 family)